VVRLILLALLTVVQVAHVHPVDTDADHCPLCILLHTAAPVALTAAIIVLIQIETRTPVLLAPPSFHPPSSHRLLRLSSDFPVSA
jgi:hypothetical protein